MYSADYYSFYADVIIPANSTINALIDVSLPVDGLSAIMTGFSFTVVRIRHSLFLPPDAVRWRGICHGDMAACASVTLMYCAQRLYSVAKQRDTRHSACG